MRVLAGDGGRLVDGQESARQRLRDLLAIGLGSYPMLRGYGTDSSLVDAADIEAAAMAAVARAMAQESNGVSDLTLRRVRVTAVDEATVVVDVDAAWRPALGGSVVISLRERLGALDSLTPDAPPATAREDSPLTWEGRPLTWEDSPLTWG